MTTMPPGGADKARLLQNLQGITSLVRAATPPTRKAGPPRLIAISKLHPASSIAALHPPQTHFGENYIQELVEKAAILPKSIKWTFCGQLQSNKAKTLAASVENLWCVESVDSSKKADQLDKGRAALKEEKSLPDLEKLRIMIQVNTSKEEQKGGVMPDNVLDLARHIREKCENLSLFGLMTIGSFENSAKSKEGEENPDFVELKKVRDHVVKELGLQEGELELSMGMSADFETAIRMGSDEVRVGTSIFGERPPKNEATV